MTVRWWCRINLGQFEEMKVFVIVTREVIQLGFFCAVLDLERYTKYITFTLRLIVSYGISSVVESLVKLCQFPIQSIVGRSFHYGSTFTVPNLADSPLLLVIIHTI